jgi:hypothetical protein
MESTNIADVGNKRTILSPRTKSLHKDKIGSFVIESQIKNLKKLNPTVPTSAIWEKHSFKHAMAVNISLATNISVEDALILVNSSLEKVFSWYLYPVTSGNEAAKKIKKACKVTMDAIIKLIDLAGFSKNTQKILPLVTKFYKDEIIQYQTNQFQSLLHLKILLKILKDEDQIFFFSLLKKKNICSHNFNSHLSSIFVENHSLMKAYFSYRKTHPEVTLDDFLETERTMFMTFIRRIRHFNRETFLKVLKYSRFKRVYDAPNKEKMLTEVAFLDTKRRERNAQAMLSTNEEILEVTRGRILKETETSMSVSKIRSDNMRFTKNVDILSEIGSLTNCCFTLEGFAKNLVIMAANSPHAGILYNKQPFPWFMFVWEGLNVETSNLLDGKILFTKNLVLDNFEASQNISIEKFRELSKEIWEKTEYKRILLGTSRNDIGFEEENPKEVFNATPRYKRSFCLLDYEKSYIEKGNTFDDSNDVFLIHSNDYDLNANVRRMESRSDLYLCRYMERALYMNLLFHTIDQSKNVPHIVNTPYEEANSEVIKYVEKYDYFSLGDTFALKYLKDKLTVNSSFSSSKGSLIKLIDGHTDSSLITQDVLETPNYILDSTTNVFGYLLTRKIDDNTIAVTDVALVSSEFSSIVATNILMDLLTWIKENNITTILMDENSNSRRFIRAFTEAGLEVKPHKNLNIDLEKLSEKRFVPPISVTFKLSK